MAKGVDWAIPSKGTKEGPLPGLMLPLSFLSCGSLTSISHAVLPVWGQRPSLPCL